MLKTAQIMPLVRLLTLWIRCSVAKTNGTIIKASVHNIVTHAGIVAISKCWFGKFQGILLCFYLFIYFVFSAFVRSVSV